MHTLRGLPVVSSTLASRVASLRCPERLSSHTMLGSAGCGHQAYIHNRALLCHQPCPDKTAHMPLCLQMLPANQAGTRNRAVEYNLGQGVEVHVVSAAGQLPAALQALKDSARDGIVAIDLEWRPSFKRKILSKAGIFSLWFTYLVQANI